MTAEICRTCQYWHPAGSTDLFFPLGTCRLIEGLANMEFNLVAFEVADDDGHLVGYDARLRTRDSFGCNQWKERA